MAPESTARRRRSPAAFNPKLLADVVRGLSEDPPVSFLRNQVILEEGQVGTRMYVVLHGWVAISIGGVVVDRIGPGGVLGELALIDQAPRLASAIAEDHVVAAADQPQRFHRAGQASPRARRGRARGDRPAPALPHRTS